MATNAMVAMAMAPATPTPTCTPLIELESHLFSFVALILVTCVGPCGVPEGVVFSIDRASLLRVPCTSAVAVVSSVLRESSLLCVRCVSVSAEEVSCVGKSSLLCVLLCTVVGVLVDA